MNKVSIRSIRGPSVPSLCAVGLCILMATGCRVPKYSRSSSYRRTGRIRASYRPGGGRARAESVQTVSTASSRRSIRRPSPASPPMRAKKEVADSGSPEYAKAPAKDKAVREGAVHSTPRDEERAPSGNRSTSKETAIRKKVAQVQKRLIIYSAKLRVSVADVDKSIEEAKKLALSMGGYLQSRSGGELVVRVPATRFHDYVESMGKFGEIFRRRIWSQDVTRKYMDLKIRLKAAMTVLKRLRELLQKTKGVEEALAVEKEIGRIVEKIERLKGVMRYLRQHAALSTVTIRFVSPNRRYRNRKPRVRRSPFPWIRRLGVRRLVRFR